MCTRQEKLKSLQKERDYALQLAESKEPPVPVFTKNSKSMNCQFQRWKSQQYSGKNQKFCNFLNFADHGYYIPVNQSFVVLRAMVTSPKKHPDNCLEPVPVSDNRPPPISTLDQKADDQFWIFQTSFFMRVPMCSLKVLGNHVSLKVYCICWCDLGSRFWE